MKYSSEHLLICIGITSLSEIGLIPSLFYFEFCPRCFPAVLTAGHYSAVTLNIDDGKRLELARALAMDPRLLLDEMMARLPEVRAKRRASAIVRTGDVVIGPGRAGTAAVTSVKVV